MAHTSTLGAENMQSSPLLGSSFHDDEFLVR